MRVVVTGGNGFIGSAVVQELIGRGHIPVVLDHERRATEAQECIVGDVRDPDLVSAVVGHADGVIHLAATLGTQETIADPRSAATTNVIGSLNVFETVASGDVPAV